MEMTVCVVDDHEEIRESLDALLSSVGLTVRLYSSAYECLSSCDFAQVGCLILDVRMPGMSGLMLQDELIARKIEVPVIFMSAHADLPLAVGAMKKGASDFFLKPFSTQSLLDSVHQAMECARRSRARAAKLAEYEARRAQLTVREREILECLRSGQSAKVIAHEMGLNRKTVDTHMAAIRRKMQAESTGELMLMLQDHPFEPPMRSI